MTRLASRSPLFAAAVALVVCAGPAPAQGIGYTLYDLGVGHAFSLNNNANVQVVGYQGSATGPATAFRFDFNAATNTVTPVALTFTGGGTHTEARGINNSGQIVGFSTTANTDPNTSAFAPTISSPYFVPAGGTTGSVMPAPPAGVGEFNVGGTQAQGINNAGEIVGLSTYVDSPTAPTFSSDHGFYTANQGGSYTLLTEGDANSPAYRISNAASTGRIAATTDNPSHFKAAKYNVNGSVNAQTGALPGSFTDAFGFAINDNGLLVGSMTNDPFNPTVEHAISFNGTTVTDLGTLGGTTGRALGVNNSSTTVGLATDSTGTERAFIQPNGTGPLLDLNTAFPLNNASGWLLEGAEDVNNAGFIVGFGLFGGQEHGFLLQPVPEPGTLLLAGSAAAGAGLFWRRRRAVCR